MLNYMRILLFFLICRHELILAEDGGEYNALLLVKAESGSSVIKTWYGFQDQNFVEGNKESILDTLQYNDNYRSRLIDQWYIDPPEKIRFSFLNDYGDPLFWITFNVTELDNNPENWNHESRILDSSLKFKQPKVAFEVTDYCEVIFKDNGTSLVWYAIFDPIFAKDREHYPRFLLTKRSDYSYALRTDMNSSLGNYEGCHTHYVPDNKAAMSPESCLRECKSSNHRLMLLGYPIGSCACGEYNHLMYTNSDDCAPCHEDPVYFCSFQYGVFGVYNIEEWQEDEFDPRQKPERGLLFTFNFNFNTSTTTVRALDNNADDPLFLTAFELNIPQSNGYEFHIMYRNSLTNLGTIIDEGGNNKIFVPGSVHNISVIRASILEINFLSTTTSAAQSVASTMSIYGYIDNFIDAPWMAAEGFWSSKDTTSTEYSTVTSFPNAVTSRSSSLNGETSQSLGSTLTSESEDTGQFEKTTSFDSMETTITSFENSEPNRLIITTNELEFPANSDPDSSAESSTISSSSLASSHSNSHSVIFDSASKTRITTLITTVNRDETTVSSQETISKSSKFDRGGSTESNPLSSPNSPTTQFSISQSHSNTVDLTSKAAITTPITAVSREETTFYSSETISRSTTIEPVTNKESNIVPCSNCSCRITFTFDVKMSPEFQQKMENVKRNLTLHRKTLTSYLRTKISASDDRTSSTGLGSLGVIVITFVIAIIVSIDVVNFFTFMKA